MASEKTGSSAGSTPILCCKNEQSIQGGLLFKSERVVVPSYLQRKMLQLLHSSHLSMEGCIHRGRESIFWPGMNAQVKYYTSKCSVCLSFQLDQCKEPLEPHDVSTRPWAKVAANLYTCNRRNYLITVDYSNHFLSSTSYWYIIKNGDRKTQCAFIRYEISDIFMRDNGPQFISDTFKCFMKKWDIRHVTSSPCYPSQMERLKMQWRHARCWWKRLRNREVISV